MAETATIDNLDIQIAATSQNAESSLSKLLSAMGELSSKISAATSALNQQTKAAVKNSSATNKTSSAMKSLSKTAENASKKIAKIPRAFGRIALYRAIRTAIKNISASVTEGLTNLKSYSEVVGTAFAPAVDNLRRHVLWLKNAFATALRPVIEALIPVIIRLVDWLSKASDFVAQVLSVLTGKVDANGRYTKAILGDLEKSNKQAKELRRTLLGFDEINRLDGETGSDDSNNAGTMFEQAEISPEAVTVAEKVAKVWEKIKEIISKIDWDKVAGFILVILALKAGIGLVKKLKAVWDVLKYIGSALSAGVVIIAAIVAVFALWGDKISSWLDKAREKIGAFFDKISTGSQMWDWFFTLIKDIIDTVMETVGTIASMVYKLFHGDFKGAFNDLIHLLATLVKGIIKIVVDVINIILGWVSDMINFIVEGAVWLWNNGIAPVFDWVYTAFQNVLIFIHNVWVDLQIGFWWLVSKIIEGLNWALEKVETVINSAIDVWNTVTGSNIKPVNLQIDSTKVDDKIEELKNTKLPQITETVQITTRITQPQAIRLSVDASGAYTAIDNIERRITNANNNLGRVAGRAALDLFSIRGYASGGFPSVGSLFVAGESGAEFVADINGRTGVYNTDQMSSALYNAMVAALQTMPQGGGDIYLDGEVIYRNTVRRNNNQVRSTGRSALIT